MFAPTLLGLALGCAPQALPAVPQLDPGVATSWEGGSVDFLRFERFLGRNFRGKQLGVQALHHLLQIQLVEIEASIAGIRVSDEAIAALVAKAHAQASEGGIDLAANLRERRISVEEFANLMRGSLLHEELVRRALEMTAEQKPTPEQLIDWSNKRTEELMAAASNATEGYALDLPPYRVSLPELGAVIRSALPPLRLREYLEQLVLEEILLQWAQQNSIVLGADVLEAEIAWRRKRVEENPAFSGMSYEKLLAAQGSSVETVRHSRELRASGLMRLYSEHEYDEAWFDRLDADEILKFDLQHGETREISWLLLHTVKKKVDPLDLDFAEATAELISYREEMSSAADFYRLAKELSEHAPSRTNGGRLGWVHRAEPGVVDKNVLQAAFSLGIDEISQPISLAGGMALVMCHQVRPSPGKSEFHQLVRRGLHLTLRPIVLERFQTRLAY